MKVELTRLRIKRGKAHRVDEWLQMINGRIGEAIETLEREGMKLEIIFREVIGEDEFLCWLTIQDEAGEPLETSPFELDHEHMKFGEECIDHEFGGHEAQPQVILLPPEVAKAMQWSDPSASVVAFERRQIIRKRGPDGIVREDGTGGS